MTNNSSVTLKVKKHKKILKREENDENFSGVRPLFQFQKCGYIVTSYDSIENTK